MRQVQKSHRRRQAADGLLSGGFGSAGLPLTARGALGGKRGRPREGLQAPSSRCWGSRPRADWHTGAGGPRVGVLTSATQGRSADLCDLCRRSLSGDSPQGKAAEPGASRPDTDPGLLPPLSAAAGPSPGWEEAPALLAPLGRDPDQMGLPHPPSFPESAHQEGDCMAQPQATPLEKVTARLPSWHHIRLELGKNHQISHRTPGRGE